MIPHFKCPKCGHSSIVSFKECPACGIILAKYLKSEEEERIFQNTRHGTTEGDSGNPILRTLKKPWIWPIPAVLIHAWVLITSETIWGEKSYITNSVNAYETDAGVVTLIAMFVLPLLYFLTFTPLFPFLVNLPGFHKRPSDSEIGCLVSLARVFVLIIFYWNSYAILTSY